MFGTARTQGKVRPDRHGGESAGRNGICGVFGVRNLTRGGTTMAEVPPAPRTPPGGSPPLPTTEALRVLLERFPPESFERGGTLIDSSLLETADFEPATEPGAAHFESEALPRVGYVVEGLVRGMWNRNAIAPANRATAIVAGDGRWIGADAFKFGKNLFRYAALTPSVASTFPLSYILDEAPREIVLDALKSVSLNWCTMASVLSLGADTLGRRTLLMLYDLSRLHPRPELEVRQKDIADMLGVTRQTLQPILKGYEKRGLISLGYQEIVIADPVDLVRRLRRKG